ncbi:Ecotropic viral integration site 5 -like protein [Echinococcus granulosus]|nr:Ecotropic viral integration site 5 -like protein [Echinococcus granulosus]
MTADAVDIGNLSADSKAVTSCSSASKFNRTSSKTSLISSLSDGSYVGGEDENNSNLFICSEKKPNRWPSFSSAFPSFINTGSNAPPPSTISLCHQWSTVINNWEQYSKKKGFIADLIRMGIPDQFRPMIWQLCTGAYGSPLKQNYHKYLRDVSPFERAIARDISRTYPKHDFFKDKGSTGQQSLFNVMKAYSLHDREVGYCQGSGFIVGLLLMQMGEEEAFAVLVQLMNEYRLRELYKPCMTELGVCMHQLDGLIAEFLPELHAHFATQTFAPSHYASAWFLTLFATAFPISMTTRVMDLFIAEGMDFILRLSLAILKQFAPRLLTMDMETMIFSLQQTESTEWEDHGRILFETALTLKLNPRRLKKLRNEYILARSQEQAEQIEVRRLRTENGLLLQRLARLEEDNTYLAKQLVGCNVERAELSEEVSRLRGCIARWQAMQEEASLRTPTTCSPPQATTAAVILENDDTKVSDSSSSTSTSPSAFYPGYEVESLPATPLPAPPLPQQPHRQQGMKMSAICNGDQTATASPRCSERSGGTGASETPTPTTSGAESWASVSFSPISVSRSSDDRLLVETIHQLETDLVHLRVRESDCHSALRDAKERIRLLEEKLESARKEPEEQIEVLHSELMKVKLREAEGLLKQKELRDRMEEIQTLWENHLALTGGGNNARAKVDSATNGVTHSSGFLRVSAGLIQSKLRGKSAATSAADNAQHLSDRLLETRLCSQIAELQQRVHELTSQAEIADRQAIRRDEKMNNLIEKVEGSILREAALRAELKEAECRCADLETKRKSDAILWRIREIELSSRIAELRQHYSELDCLHDVEHASNTLQGHPTGGPLSACSSVAPTPEVQRSRGEGDGQSKGIARGHVPSMWKDLPPALMTESIGPLEDLCILPDDPLITSIYVHESSANQHGITGPVTRYRGYETVAAVGTSSEVFF